MNYECLLELHCLLVISLNTDPQKAVKIRSHYQYGMEATGDHVVCYFQCRAQVAAQSLSERNPQESATSTAPSTT